MSMTRGPIVPPNTGSSTDFPVSLSVSVIVPVVILLPSIDPPLIAEPAGGCLMQCKNRPVARAWQTPASTHRSGGVGNPAQALLPAENAQHFENAGGRERAGQRCAQRLSQHSETYVPLLGEIAKGLAQAGF